MVLLSNKDRSLIKALVKYITQRAAHLSPNEKELFYSELVNEIIEVSKED